MARKNQINNWQHDWTAAWSKLQQAAVIGSESDPQTAAKEILPLAKETLALIERLILLQNRDT